MHVVQWKTIESVTPERSYILNNKLNIFSTPRTPLLTPATTIVDILRYIHVKASHMHRLISHDYLRSALTIVRVASDSGVEK